MKPRSKPSIANLTPGWEMLHPKPNHLALRPYRLPHQLVQTPLEKLLRSIPFKIIHVWFEVVVCCFSNSCSIEISPLFSLLYCYATSVLLFSSLLKDW